MSTATKSRIVITRGMRRQQARQARCQQRVPPHALLVAVDLAREKQAVCLMQHQRVVGRILCETPAENFAPIFTAADEWCREHQVQEQVFAMEPAGHYWMLLAEQCEARAKPYVLLHPLSVARERESARYNREKTDPRDAEWIANWAAQGKITETVLPRTHAHAALQDLAYAYFDARRHAASARTALHNFWHRLVPEFFTIFRDATRDSALATALALKPFSEMCRLTPEAWLVEVRRHMRKTRLQKKRVLALHAAILAAAQQPHRRAGEGMPWRIRLAAERRRLLETHKQLLRERILEHYAARPEAAYLDSITGADVFHNALTLGLIGELEAYDDPRTLVKLAGLEINHFQSGTMKKNSHISYRGRVRLRTAAYQQARFLVKRNPVYAARFAQLLRDKKFSAQQCYVAIANSYLRTMHVLAKTKTFYRAPTTSNT